MVGRSALGLGSLLSRGDEVRLIEYLPSVFLLHSHKGYLVEQCRTHTEDKYSVAEVFYYSSRYPGFKCRLKQGKYQVSGFVNPSLEFSTESINFNDLAIMLS